MSTGWRVVPMANICSIKNGKSNSVDATDDGEYAFFDRSKKIKKSARYLYDCEALIIPGEGAEFLPRHFIGKFDLHQRAYALFDFIEDIDVKFLYYYLIYNKDYFVKVAVGATVKSLRLRHFEQLPAPVPPIEVQRRIVAILDEAVAGIATATANAEKNLQNARELFESTLQSVFVEKGEGWVECKLSEVCEGKITDGTHQTPRYFDEGYIFLSSRNVTSRSIDWDNIKYIDEAQHVAMQKRLAPRLNDILLAKNGTTGVAAIVDKDVVFDIYVSLALLRPSKKIDHRYLWHFINSPVAKQQFNRRLKGIGVPNLHLKEIRDVAIPYPEKIEEQKKLVEQLDKLDNEFQRLEEIYNKKRNELSELKQSILQKAFAGELH